MPIKRIKKPSRFLTEFEKRSRGIKKNRRKQRRVARVKKTVEKKPIKPPNLT